MKFRALISYRAAFALTLTLTAAAPVSAESLLEQLQKEVTQLVNRTKNAVVTVEEDTTLIRKTENNGAPALDPNLSAPGHAYVGVPVLKDFPAIGKLFPTDPNAADTYKALTTLNTANQLFYFNGPKSGTGFSIGDGYIVTTADVLEGMKNPIIEMDNGTRVRAKVVGVNGDLNVGLVRVSEKINLPALKLGDSGQVNVGNFALSIGNQAGDANTVALMMIGNVRTEGTYSGQRFYPGLLQIAGTVSAGSSGAPVVDVHGDVIGVMVGAPASGSFWQSRFVPGVFGTPSLNVKPKSPFVRPNGAPQKRSDTTVPKPDPNLDPQEEHAVATLIDPNITTTEKYSAPLIVGEQPATTSAGYAVPINDLKAAIEEIKSGKPMVAGWMGVQLADQTVTTEEDSQVIRLDKSVRIAEVLPNSPALRAKLMVGDVIVSMNGKAVHTGADVRDVTVRMRPGDTLRVSVKRRDETKTLEVKIEARPAQPLNIIVKPGQP